MNRCASKVKVYRGRVRSLELDEAGGGRLPRVVASISIAGATVLSTAILSCCPATTRVHVCWARSSMSPGV